MTSSLHVAGQAKPSEMSQLPRPDHLCFFLLAPGPPSPCVPGPGGHNYQLMDFEARRISNFEVALDQAVASDD